MITKRNEHLRLVQKLAEPVTSLKGLGPKRADLLARKGLHSILDLLFFTPARYEDRTRVFPIRSATEGVPALFKGRVTFGREERFSSSRKRLFKIVIRDEESDLELLWFQYRKPHLTRFAGRGTELLVYGGVRMNRGKRQMIHPDISAPDQGKKGPGWDGFGYYPVYSAVQGVSSHMMRSIIKSALSKYLESLIDPIPSEITDRVGLPSLSAAIKFVHFPPEDSSISRLNRFDTPFHRRLVFDRFFLVMLIMAFRKKSRERKAGLTFSVPPSLMDDLKAFFPFELTPYQKKAIGDMVNDLTGPKIMNRLLLGDVGCGKTVVAMVAAYLCALNQYQMAMMVPTQVLANQHYETFSGLSGKMGLRPVLLTGKLKKSERREIYEKIGNSGYNLVIGTQSLIQEVVSFSNLGLVIIDEQQRFGVRDRGLLNRKGEDPHLLAMTATPIPRTLAMTLYGDMDLSLIEGYPEGHDPVITQLLRRDEKRKAFDTLKERLSAGQQAFVICPVIEGSEDRDLKNALWMAEKLKKLLSPTYRIGLVHGRLSPDEKEDVMNGFRKGFIDVLVGTTVVEVGVHIPGANLMIIEHPERFGLAQLHQLRGRVGRGSETGLCLMMLGDDIPGNTLSRLTILAETSDGFEIAKKDLILRGQGELTGVKQAGLGELDPEDMMRESELLSQAKREAHRLIDSDPELLRPESELCKVIAESILAKPLDL